MSQNSQLSDHSNRRDFLKHASAGIAAAAAIQAAPTYAAKGANDQIVVGLIGCGNRGTHDAETFSKTPNVKVAYVCDVDEARRGKAAEKLGVDSSRIVADMRKILDD